MKIMKIKLMLAALALTVSGCGILEEDISGDRVRIIAPADRVTLAQGLVEFRWQAAEYASGYTFTLVSPSFDAAERVLADTVIYADSLARHFGMRLELDAGKYEWRVGAFNSAYETRTTVRSLTVEAPDEPADPEEPENPDDTGNPGEQEQSGNGIESSDPAGTADPVRSGLDIGRSDSSGTAQLQILER